MTLLKGTLGAKLDIERGADARSPSRVRRGSRIEHSGQRAEADFVKWKDCSSQI